MFDLLSATFTDRFFCLLDAAFGITWKMKFIVKVTDVCNADYTYHLSLLCRKKFTHRKFLVVGRKFFN
jgi:hypothetical protein